jgi:dihydroorotate dehydrogenase
VIGSLIVADEGRTLELAAAMEAAGLRMLELNLSAPHGEEAAPGAIRLERVPERIFALTERVRRAVRIPLLVKLSGQTEDVLAEVEAACRGGADGVVLMGRYLGFVPDVTRRQPLLGTFAAIGGGWALPLTLRWIAKARQRFGPERSLVATNGVRSGLDVARCLLAGAGAAEVCSIVMTDGYPALGRLVDELSAWLMGQGIERVADIIGEAADAVQTYQTAGEARTDSGEWQRFAAGT